MASDRGIPRHVRTFINEHLRSITQLDLLMRLHAAPQRTFTAEELSRELRIPERFLNSLLLDFASAGVLVADDSPVPAWRFDRNGRHARTVDDLEQCVAQRKRTVQDMILAALDGGDVQVFSDAFRIRRDR